MNITKTIPLTQPSPNGRGKQGENGGDLESQMPGPMNCEAKGHTVVRDLIAAIPPHVALSCRCETCGQEWYETYARTSMRQ